MSSALEEKLLATLATMEQKIDNLTSLHLETRRMANNNHLEIMALKAEVVMLKKENNEFKQELLLVKDSNNRREQQSRELTIRVLGMPVSEEESREGAKFAVKAVYDRVFKPILATAKTNGLIDGVPQFNNCIEEGFRMGKGVNDSKGRPLPPPLVIKLKSKTIKAAIFKSKRAAMPNMEKATGFKMFIVEDLTVPTVKKMKELKDDRRVGKVWTVEGNIKYTLADQPDTIIKLSSVFKPLNEILK